MHLGVCFLGPNLLCCLSSMPLEVLIAWCAEIRCRLLIADPQDRPSVVDCLGFYVPGTADHCMHARS
ncbi:hypothetical protein GDO78_009018 [Eleutherodactylus coqui]|uniref:Secreted protein n=1 Tax=Eleutherodactylus coqui TaxID=57060 RepID=A0A8J6K9Z9_ELECQ|nr:hypothetical protein GDO78_009018 [Eleutherodactylus coqui]